MRPSVTRVGSTVDVGRRNGVVDTAWTGTEVSRARQREQSVRLAVQKDSTCKKIPAVRLVFCHAKYVSMLRVQTAAFGSAVAGGGLRELYCL